MSEFSFSKSEKLTSKKLIQSVFRKGETFYTYPLKIFFLSLPPNEAPQKIQVLVSVPKRHFKKAVTRNKIKRQLREVFRLNKPVLLKNIEKASDYFCINIVYIGKKNEPYTMLNEAFIAFIRQLGINNEA